MIAELIMRLFHARTAAHVMHLQTTSYAKHVALNEFYDAIVGFADSIAEGYQGEHGMIDFKSPHRYVQDADPVRYLSELKEWVEKNRYEAVEAEDTFLQNVIDEVVHLCSTTIYKLKVLK
jgi:Family of unknown function (DUF5856)